jgi:SAM-dependent methyltransferase
MKLFTWDLAGFEKAYVKYYYMPHLNDCEDGVDGDGHFHDTLHECGRASCICAFEDELITYSRLFFKEDKIFADRAEGIISKLNMKAGSSVFVLGCGFGYLLNELADRRMNVWGCDNSTYIHFNTDTEADYPIHNIDVLSSTFADDVLNATGIAKFDYVVSEDLLTSYDNNTEPSMSTILSNMETILKVGKPLENIINIVTVNCPSPFVTKTLDEWKQVNPNYTWLGDHGTE